MLGRVSGTLPGATETIEGFPNQRRIAFNMLPGTFGPSQSSQMLSKSIPGVSASNPSFSIKLQWKPVPNAWREGRVELGGELRG